MLPPDDLQVSLDMPHHLAQYYESHLLSYLGSTEHNFNSGSPLYQQPAIRDRWIFDFKSVRMFAKAKKKRRCLLSDPSDEPPQLL